MNCIWCWKEMNNLIGPIVKQVCNIAVHELQFFLFCLKRKARHLGRYEPSYPSTKELHGWSELSKKLKYVSLIHYKTILSLTDPTTKQKSLNSTNRVFGSYFLFRKCLLNTLLLFWQKTFLSPWIEPGVGSMKTVNSRLLLIN